MLRKIISTTFFLLIGILTLSACANGDETATEANNTAPTVEPTPSDEFDIPDEDLPLLDGTLFEALKSNPAVMLQLTPVAEGEELVVLHTNHGDITLRLFPDDAPIAVENFVTHARNGFYDGVIFHRVIEEFMIQGGDPDGTGMGGHSIWGESFGLEPSFNLRHFRGALAMAHAGGAMGSQFYIVHNSNLDPGFANEMQEILLHQNMPMGRFEDGTRIYVRDVYTADSTAYFLENGGTPHLDWLWSQQGHTVFGHVVDGMDIVDEIAQVAVEARTHRPYEDVIIETISFITYGES